MRRAKLKAHEVTRVILTSTMTPPTYKETVDKLMADRRTEGYLDVGWHYFVDRNARVHFGIPATERGSYFERYSESSVVILIEGMDDYSLEQFAALRRLIETTQREYPGAVVTMHYELFRGVNPGFDQGELYEQS